VFRLQFAGLIFFSASLYAQFPAGGPLPPRVAPAATLLTASGERSIFDEFPPLPSDPKPITGVVSVRELQHPIPRKATQKAFDAQKLANANKIPQAIARLEEAVGIAPEYRDAHWNLGALNGKLGRLAEAKTEFLKAIEIGPPAPAIYFNLGLISLENREYAEAQNWAKKALALDPSSSRAKMVLEVALSH
jgi:tetratricopeptide (TPR) repeat protein